MVDLDLADTYQLLDPSELRHRIRLLPRHCEDAWRRVAGFAAPWDGESIERVVFGGMGGSAIAGDLVVDLASQPGGSVRRADVSMAVVRGFEFPDRLDTRSLAVLCSYSGNTEETLSLYREARQTAARILVVTAGGKLLEEASAAGIPALDINAPGEPRSAVGYNLMLLLGAMNGLGLAVTRSQEVAQAVAALDRQNARLAEDVPTADNPAKRLATELAGKTVIVCGGGTFSGVGRRWKSQLNENAKAWAFFEEVPELLHNTVEAFGNRAGGEQGMATLLLQPRSGNPEMLERLTIVSEMLKRCGLPHRVLEAVDGPPLAQVLCMLSLGDWVSYYMALLRGIDPSRTPAIDLGKEMLVRMRRAPGGESG